MAYKSILGFDCYTKSQKVVEYPSDLIELFTDHIDFCLLEVPVVLSNNPLTVYNRNTIIQWFASSNIEPVSGLKLEKMVKYQPVLNYFMAMLLLEQKDDKLLFHQPNIDLINFAELASNILKFDNNKQIPVVQNWNKPTKYAIESKISLDKNIVELDIDTYVKDYQESFDEYRNFTLNDIMLNDIVTGMPIKQPVFNKQNLIIDFATTRRGNIYYPDTIKKHTFEITDPVSCKVLYNSIKDKLPVQKYMCKSFRKYEDKELVNFSTFFKLDNSCVLNVRGKDFYMETTATHENMYNRYIETKDKIKNGDYKRFDENRRILSCLVRNAPDYLLVQNSESRSGGNLDNLRRDLGFPILSSCGLYCDDFSFLNLYEMIFKGQTITTSIFGAPVPVTNLKGIEFIGTDLEKASFENINFASCAFIGSCMKNMVFRRCSFTECVFYKNDMLNALFDGCRFDNKTRTMMHTIQGITILDATTLRSGGLFGSILNSTYSLPTISQAISAGMELVEDPPYQPEENDEIPQDPPVLENDEEPNSPNTGGYSDDD